MLNRAILIATAAILCAGFASPLRAQAVGTASAVNPASTGTPPGGAGRTIEIGSEVVFRERIQTTSSGAVQVLFVDRTALTVGSNSDVTIDEFVYNPNARTGTFVATLARGSLRFVGGQISRNSGATIKSGTATIGIRGSVVGVIDFGGGLQVKNWQGSVVINLPGAPSYQLQQGTQVNIVVDPATGQQTASEPQAVTFPTTGSETAGSADPNSGAGAPGTGAPPPAGGGGTTTAQTGNPPAPPIFVPDPVTDVYFQDPPPPSPPEPDPDPPPPPPPLP